MFVCQVADVLVRHAELDAHHQYVVLRIIARARPCWICWMTLLQAAIGRMPPSIGFRGLIDRASNRGCPAPRPSRCDHHVVEDWAAGHLGARFSVNSPTICSPSCFANSRRRRAGLRWSAPACPCRRSICGRRGSMIGHRYSITLLLYIDKHTMFVIMNASSCMDISARFGKKVREIRLNKKLSQGDV